MKIAILGSAYPYRGGLSNYNERLAEALQNQGHEVEIFTFTVQYPNFLFPGKSQYNEDPAPKNLKITRCLNSTNPLNWIKVGKMIKDVNADLLIVKFWLPFMGPAFGKVLRGVKQNKKTKVVCIVDNMIPHEKRIGDKMFSKYFIKPVDAFIAMTQSVLDDIKLFDKTKPKLLSPHPLYDNFGAQMPKQEALKKIGITKNVNTILFFGVIRDYKGLDLLLKAYADERFRNDNYQLLIAGEYYADKPLYVKMIEDLKIGNNTHQFDRFIPDSEVGYFFNAADLVVQPYKAATQSGVTQIAYHFNKPMVVTDVGGLSEMVPNGKAGYVVNPQPNEIADAIFKYFEKTDRNQMQASIINEKKKYSWDILTKNIFNLADKIKQ